jgi:transposase
LYIILIMHRHLSPNDPAAFKEQLFDLSAKYEASMAEMAAMHEAVIDHHKSQLADKDQYISQLQDQIRLLKALTYQARSEKARPHQDEKQYHLFNEAEMISSLEDTDAPGDEAGACQIPAYTRKKRGRRPIPQEYPRVDVLHDIPEEEKVCTCGCILSRIGEEISEKLSIVPQKIQVMRHIRPKYACRACEGVEDDGPTVKTAPLPAQIIPQGIVTPGLLAYILVNKFADGLPFYRQSAMFERLGVDISRSTMSAWTLRTAKACQPLIELLQHEIRSGPLINMDETRLLVLKEPGRKNTSKSYMWVARGGQPKRPVVLFHYDPGRGGKVAEKIVGGFQGYLQTDGYAGYKALGQKKGITHVGCLAHVRRKFHDVIKAGGKKKKGAKGGTAQTVINLIAELYHQEKQAREKGLEPDQVKQLRQERVKPIMDKIKAILDERYESTPPKSLLGKAISYAQGQWDRVEIYLENGILRPDNNAAENAIRPFVVGRKNWLFSGSPKGAHASAAIYSLIESAKANGLNPYEYLIQVFEKLPAAKSQDDLKALLPHNYKHDPAKD